MRHTSTRHTTKTLPGTNTAHGAKVVRINPPQHTDNSTRTRAKINRTFVVAVILGRSIPKHEHEHTQTDCNSYTKVALLFVII